MAHLTSREFLRFAEKFSIGDGCWEWTASFKPAGYGQLRLRGRTCYAHRVSYEEFVGLIPEGLYIDHLCRNRACVRPDHLEAVTNAENVRRGTAGEVNRARQLAKTHCRRGHRFAGENLYVRPNGDRACRTCRRSGNKISTS